MQEREAEGWWGRVEIEREKYYSWACMMYDFNRCIIEYGSLLVIISISAHTSKGNNAVAIKGLSLDEAPFSLARTLPVAFSVRKSTA